MTVKGVTTNMRQENRYIPGLKQTWIESHLNSEDRAVADSLASQTLKAKIKAYNIRPCSATSGMLFLKCSHSLTLIIKISRGRIPELLNDSEFLRNLNDGKLGFSKF